MPPLHILMRPHGAVLRSPDMPGDIIAIVLGIVAFAVLYLMIEGIDRV